MRPTGAFYPWRGVGIGDSEGVLTQLQDRSAGPEVFVRAVELARGKDYDQALPIFLDIAEGRLGQFTKKRRLLATAEALRCLCVLKRWPEAETLSRQVSERSPEAWWAFTGLGEALLQQGRTKEAKLALAQAIEIAPEREEPRAILEAARAGATLRSRRVRGWPAKREAFEDARALVERYVLRGLPDTAIVEPDTAFMTLGSCFADHLGLRLREAGYTVNGEAIGEDINSTYANRYLLQWIENGPVDAPTALMERVYGPETRERFLLAIRRSDVFVMTLGVASCFFHSETGEFAFVNTKLRTARDFLQGEHVMRTTSVTENVRNIRMMFEIVRRLARRPPKFILTVSPVPLGGTTEFESAVIADCISKSTLRLACHEVVSDESEDDVYYWPSFEIIRWLGAHFGPEHPPIYGADDGNTRHASGWIVQLIVDLFLSHHAGSKIGAASQAGLSDALGV